MGLDGIGWDFLNKKNYLIINYFKIIFGIYIQFYYKSKLGKNIFEFLDLGVFFELFFDFLKISKSYLESTLNFISTQNFDKN